MFHVNSFTYTRTPFYETCTSSSCPAYEACGLLPVLIVDTTISCGEENVVPGKLTVGLATLPMLFFIAQMIMLSIVVHKLKLEKQNANIN